MFVFGTGLSTFAHLKGHKEICHAQPPPRLSSSIQTARYESGYSILDVTTRGKRFRLNLDVHPGAHARFGPGHAHLWAGRFLREATPGGNYSYPYAFVAYNF